MFFAKLYKHSKTLFISLIVFLFVFIFLNIKWGVVATPVYQFGMFSGIMHVRDTQTVFHFYVNDTLIDISPFSFAKRDMLQASILRFRQQEEKNKMVYTTMKRLLNTTGPGKLMYESLYTNALSDHQFKTWYRSRLEDIIGYPIKKMAVYSQYYVWQNGKLVSLNLPQKEIVIDAE